MSKNIFKHYDGVIYDDAKDQNQAEEGQAVDGKTDGIHDNKGEKESNGNADGSEKGVSKPHGGPEDKKH